MSKKNKPDIKGFVYSTDPDFRFEAGREENLTIPPAGQTLRVRVDKRHRAGKVVTLIEGFEGASPDLEDLAKKLKSHCGTGGSAKDGEVIIQGDQLEKVFQWLLKNGYSKTKKA